MAATRKSASGSSVGTTRRTNVKTTKPATAKTDSGKSHKSKPAKGQSRAPPVSSTAPPGRVSKHPNTRTDRQMKAALTRSGVGRHRQQTDTQNVTLLSQPPRRTAKKTLAVVSRCGSEDSLNMKVRALSGNFDNVDRSKQNQTTSTPSDSLNYVTRSDKVTVNEGIVGNSPEGLCSGTLDVSRESVSGTVDQQSEHVSKWQNVHKSGHQDNKLKSSEDSTRRPMREVDKKGQVEMKSDDNKSASTGTTPTEGVGKETNATTFPMDTHQSENSQQQSSLRTTRISRYLGVSEKGATRQRRPKVKPKYTDIDVALSDAESVNTTDSEDLYNKQRSCSSPASSRKTSPSRFFNVSLEKLKIPSGADPGRFKLDLSKDPVENRIDNFTNPVIKIEDGADLDLAMNNRTDNEEYVIGEVCFSDEISDRVSSQGNGHHHQQSEINSISLEDLRKSVHNCSFRLLLERKLTDGSKVVVPLDTVALIKGLIDPISLPRECLWAQDEARVRHPATSNVSVINCDDSITVATEENTLECQFSGRNDMSPAIEVFSSEELSGPESGVLVVTADIHSNYRDASSCETGVAAEEMEQKSPSRVTDTSLFSGGDLETGSDFVSHQEDPTLNRKVDILCEKDPATMLKSQSQATDTSLISGPVLVTTLDFSSQRDRTLNQETDESSKESTASMLDHQLNTDTKTDRLCDVDTVSNAHSTKEKNLPCNRVAETNVLCEDDTGGVAAEVLEEVNLSRNDNTITEFNDMSSSFVRDTVAMTEVVSCDSSPNCVAETQKDDPISDATKCTNENNDFGISSSDETSTTVTILDGKDYTFTTGAIETNALCENHALNSPGRLLGSDDSNLSEVKFKHGVHAIVEGKMPIVASIEQKSSEEIHELDKMVEDDTTRLSKGQVDMKEIITCDISEEKQSEYNYGNTVNKAVEEPCLEMATFSNSKEKQVQAQGKSVDNEMSGTECVQEKPAQILQTTVTGTIKSGEIGPRISMVTVIGNKITQESGVLVSSKAVCGVTTHEDISLVAAATDSTTLKPYVQGLQIAINSKMLDLSRKDGSPPGEQTVCMDPDEMYAENVDEGPIDLSLKLEGAEEEGEIAMEQEPDSSITTASERASSVELPELKKYDQTEPEKQPRTKSHSSKANTPAVHHFVSPRSSRRKAKVKTCSCCEVDMPLLRPFGYDHEELFEDDRKPKRKRNRRIKKVEAEATASVGEKSHNTPQESSNLQNEMEHVDKSGVISRQVIQEKVAQSLNKDCGENTVGAAQHKVVHGEADSGLKVNGKTASINMEGSAEVDVKSRMVDNGTLITSEIALMTGEAVAAGLLRNAVVVGKTQLVNEQKRSHSARKTVSGGKPRGVPSESTHSTVPHRLDSGGFLKNMTSKDSQAKVKKRDRDSLNRIPPVNAEQNCENNNSTNSSNTHIKVSNGNSHNVSIATNTQLVKPSDANYNFLDRRMFAASQVGESHTEPLSVTVDTTDIHGSKQASGVMGSPCESPKETGVQSPEPVSPSHTGSRDTGEKPKQGKARTKADILARLKWKKTARKSMSDEGLSPSSSGSPRRSPSALQSGSSVNATINSGYKNPIYGPIPTLSDLTKMASITQPYVLLTDVFKQVEYPDKESEHHVKAAKKRLEESIVQDIITRRKRSPKSEKSSGGETTKVFLYSPSSRKSLQYDERYILHAQLDSSSESEMAYDEENENDSEAGPQAGRLDGDEVTGDGAKDDNIKHLEKQPCNNDVINSDFEPDIPSDLEPDVSDEEVDYEEWMRASMLDSTAEEAGNVFMEESSGGRMPTGDEDSGQAAYERVKQGSADQVLHVGPASEGEGASSQQDSEAEIDLDKMAAAKRQKNGTTGIASGEIYEGSEVALEVSLEDTVSDSEVNQADTAAAVTTGEVCSQQKGNTPEHSGIMPLSRENNKPGLPAPEVQNAAVTKVLVEVLEPGQLDNSMASLSDSEVPCKDQCVAENLVISGNQGKSSVETPPDASHHQGSHLTDNREHLSSVESSDPPVEGAHMHTGGWLHLTTNTNTSMATSAEAQQQKAYVGCAAPVYEEISDAEDTVSPIPEPVDLSVKPSRNDGPSEAVVTGPQSYAKEQKAETGASLNCGDGKHQLHTETPRSSNHSSQEGLKSEAAVGSIMVEVPSVVSSVSQSSAPVLRPESENRQSPLNLRLRNMGRSSNGGKSGKERDAATPVFSVKVTEKSHSAFHSTSASAENRGVAASDFSGSDSLVSINVGAAVQVYGMTGSMSDTDPGMSESFDDTLEDSDSEAVKRIKYSVFNTPILKSVQPSNENPDKYSGTLKNNNKLISKQTDSSVSHTTVLQYSNECAEQFKNPLNDGKSNAGKPPVEGYDKGDTSGENTDTSSFGLIDPFDPNIVNITATNLVTEIDGKTNLSKSVNKTTCDPVIALSTDGTFDYNFDESSDSEDDGSDYDLFASTSKSSIELESPVKCALTHPDRTVETKPLRGFKKNFVITSSSDEDILKCAAFSQQEEVVIISDDDDSGDEACMMGLLSPKCEPEADRVWPSEEGVEEQDWGINWGSGDDEELSNIDLDTIEFDWKPQFEAEKFDCRVKLKNVLNDDTLSPASTKLAAKVKASCSSNNIESSEHQVEPTKFSASNRKGAGHIVLHTDPAIVKVTKIDQFHGSSRRNKTSETALRKTCKVTMEESDQETDDDLTQVYQDVVAEKLPANATNITNMDFHVQSSDDETEEYQCSSKLPLQNYIEDPVKEDTNETFVEDNEMTQEFCEDLFKNEMDEETVVWLDSPRSGQRGNCNDAMQCDQGNRNNTKPGYRGNQRDAQPSNRGNHNDTKSGDQGNWWQNNTKKESDKPEDSSGKRFTLVCRRMSDELLFTESSEDCSDDQSVLTGKSTKAKVQKTEFNLAKATFLLKKLPSEKNIDLNDPPVSAKGDKTDDDTLSEGSDILCDILSVSDDISDLSPKSRFSKGNSQKMTVDAKQSCNLDDDSLSEGSDVLCDIFNVSDDISDVSPKSRINEGNSQKMTVDVKKSCKLKDKAEHVLRESHKLAKSMKKVTHEAKGANEMSKSDKIFSWPIQIRNTSEETESSDFEILNKRKFVEPRKVSLKRSCYSISSSDSEVEVILDYLKTHPETNQGSTKSKAFHFNSDEESQVFMTDESPDRSSSTSSTISHPDTESALILQGLLSKNDKLSGSELNSDTKQDTLMEKVDMKTVVDQSNVASDFIVDDLMPEDENGQKILDHPDSDSDEIVKEITSKSKHNITGHVKHHGVKSEALEMRTEIRNEVSQGISTHPARDLDENSKNVLGHADSDSDEIVRKIAPKDKDNLYGHMKHSGIKSEPVEMRTEIRNKVPREKFHPDSDSEEIVKMITSKSMSSEGFELCGIKSKSGETRTEPLNNMPGVVSIHLDKSSTRRNSGVVCSIKSEPEETMKELGENKKEPEETKYKLGLTKREPCETIREPGKTKAEPVDDIPSEMFDDWMSLDKIKVEKVEQELNLPEFGIDDPKNIEHQQLGYFPDLNKADMVGRSTIQDNVDDGSQRTSSSQSTKSRLKLKKRALVEEAKLSERRTSCLPSEYDNADTELYNGDIDSQRFTDTERDEDSDKQGSEFCSLIIKTKKLELVKAGKDLDSSLVIGKKKPEILKSGSELDSLVMEKPKKTVSDDSYVVDKKNLAAIRGDGQFGLLGKKKTCNIERDVSSLVSEKPEDINTDGDCGASVKNRAEILKDQLVEVLEERVYLESKVGSTCTNSTDDPDLSENVQPINKDVTVMRVAMDEEPSNTNIKENVTGYKSVKVPHAELEEDSVQRLELKQNNIPGRDSKEKTVLKSVATEAKYDFIPMDRDNSTFATHVEKMDTKQSKYMIEAPKPDTEVVASNPVKECQFYSKKTSAKSSSKKAGGSHIVKLTEAQWLTERKGHKYLKTSSKEKVATGSSRQNDEKSVPRYLPKTGVKESGKEEVKKYKDSKAKEKDRKKDEVVKRNDEIRETDRKNKILDSSTKIATSKTGNSGVSGTNSRSSVAADVAMDVASGAAEAGKRKSTAGLGIREWHNKKRKVAEVSLHQTGGKSKKRGKSANLLPVSGRLSPMSLKIRKARLAAVARQNNKDMEEQTGAKNATTTHSSVPPTASSCASKTLAEAETPHGARARTTMDYLDTDEIFHASQSADVAPKKRRADDVEWSQMFQDIPCANTTMFTPVKQPRQSSDHLPTFKQPEPVISRPLTTPSLDCNDGNKDMVGQDSLGRNITLPETKAVQDEDLNQRKERESPLQGHKTLEKFTQIQGRDHFKKDKSVPAQTHQPEKRFVKPLPQASKKLPHVKPVPLKPFPVASHATVTSAVPTLMPKSLGNLPAANITVKSPRNVMDFIWSMLKWNALWLEEQARVGQAPPVVDKTKVWPLLETYDSYEDYLKIMTPLMLMELWESIYKSWSDSNQCGRKSHFEMIPIPSGNMDKKRRMIDCVFQGVVIKGQEQRTPAPSESDLVVIHLPIAPQKPGLPVEVKHVFGYVTSVKRGFLRPGQVVHDMLKPRDPKQRLIVVEASIKLLYRNINVVQDTLINVEVIDSMVSQMRQFAALLFLPRSPLAKEILRPDNPRVFHCRQNSNAPAHGTFNKMQSAAIHAVCEAVKEPYVVPKICLLQGPPGTGKSSTIIGIIRKIVHNHIPTKSSPKACILLCAPSNGGIDELARRLICDRKRATEKAANKENRPLNIVRVGKLSSIHRDVQKYSLAELIQRNYKIFQQEKLKQTMSSVHSALTDLNTKIDRVQTQIQLLQTQGKKQVDRLQRDLAQLNKRKGRLDQGASADKPMSNADEHRIRREILMNADVVCCTLNSSGSNMIIDSLAGLVPGNAVTTKSHFCCVIIDEATQTTELDTLIPLQYGATKLILVGDPEQLPATVLSRSASDQNFNQSLFERLYTFLKHTPLNPVIMLQIQYRMHPEICSFPSEHVYYGLLQTDSEVSKRRSAVPLKHQLLFDVKFSQEVQPAGQRGSTSNQNEAEVTLALCEEIRANRKSAMLHIGVITPYQTQRRIIEDMLRRRRLSESVEVGTVDGYQGREKDVVIVSCVRANSNTGSIGFLADRRRMNVALTRAKYALYVIGHLKTLKVNEDWRSLINHATNHGQIVEINSKRETRDMVRRCLTD